MSKFKDVYKTSKSIASQIRGKRVYNGQQLKGLNRQKVLSAQRLWVLAIASFRATFNLKVTKTKFEPLIKVLNEIDVKQFLSTLSECDSALLQNQLISESTLNSAEPRRLCRETLRLLGYSSRDWFQNNDETSFAVLHQVFAMLNRLSLDLDELRQTAYEAWLDTERRPYPEAPEQGVEVQVITQWFPKADKEVFYEDFLMRHGSGQLCVPTRCQAEKYLYCRLDASLHVFLSQIGYPFNREVSPFIDSTISRDEYYRPCKVTFVNKTWKTYRTISMERPAAMLVQQGIGHCLDAYIKSRKTGFSRYWAVNSEWKNRQLTWLGSLHGVYDTIDLSAASDSVTWDLVKKWFRHSLLNYGVRCTRTKYVEVEQDSILSVYEQQKFAPMGSRLCFPIETIVFGAIAYAACERAGLPPDSDLYPNFVVYGDDIVIRHEATDQLVQRLTELGFVVNRSKSFTGWTREFCFRESCGLECLNGIDVTPIRISRNGFQGLPDPHTVSVEEHGPLIAGLIDLANSTRRKIPFVHYYLVEWLVETRLPIAWDSTGSSGLISENPSYPAWYSKRWNTDLQRPEVRVVRITRTKRQNKKVNDNKPRPHREWYASYDDYRKALHDWQDNYYVSYLDWRLGPQLLWQKLVELETRQPSTLSYMDESGTNADYGFINQPTLESAWILDPAEAEIWNQTYEEIRMFDLLQSLANQLCQLIFRK